MPITSTKRIQQIADDLREQGAYTAANSVDAILNERDGLLQAALPFCNIEETASASIGQVTPAEVNKLREVVAKCLTAAENWQPSLKP